VPDKIILIKNKWSVSGLNSMLTTEIRTETETYYVKDVKYDKNDLVRFKEIIAVPRSKGISDIPVSICFNREEVLTHLDSDVFLVAVKPKEPSENESLHEMFDKENNPPSAKKHDKLVKYKHPETSEEFIVTESAIPLNNLNKALYRDNLDVGFPNARR